MVQRKRGFGEYNQIKESESEYKLKAWKCSQNNRYYLATARVWWHKEKLEQVLAMQLLLESSIDYENRH